MLDEADHTAVVGLAKCERARSLHRQHQGESEVETLLENPDEEGLFGEKTMPGIVGNRGRLRPQLFPGCIISGVADWLTVHID